MIDTWLRLPGEAQLQWQPAGGLKNVLIILGDGAKSLNCSNNAKTNFSCKRYCFLITGQGFREITVNK